MHGRPAEQEMTFAKRSAAVEKAMQMKIQQVGNPIGGTSVQCYQRIKESKTKDFLKVLHSLLEDMSARFEES